MRLLLDTHIAIWAAIEDDKLSLGERAALYEAEILCVSAVSVWEARLKWHSFHKSGARKGVIAPAALLKLVAVMGWPLLGLSAQHAATDLLQPLAHRDPFDELLLVQAQVEGLRLLTRDQAFRDHPLALLA